MPKRPKPKIKGAVERTPSAAKLKRIEAQKNRELTNKQLEFTQWEVAKLRRKVKRKPLQESYKTRMEKTSDYKSKGKHATRP